jgi:enoyl-CoA hydratase/carnithine racemase
MELKSTKYRVDGGIAYITLSRPGRRNAWTGRMHAEYRYSCALAEADSTVRAIIVHGDPEGGTFCVGADSTALEGHVTRGGYDDGLPTDVAAPGTNQNPAFQAHFAWQQALRVPIVAAINGACAGVALALVAFTDLRFVKPDAVLTTAAPRLGLPAEYGLSWILPRVMNRMTAVDLLLSGRRITGAEVAAAGFAIAETAPLDAATKWVRELTVVAAPSSVEMTKRQLADDLVSQDVAASIGLADKLLADAMRGSDFAEGVAALQAKRLPRWE